MERDEHMRRLDQLLTDCFARRGHTVLLEGPIAGGRTELLRAFAAHATRRGARFLGASCSPAESALPFGMVNQLFRGTDWPGEQADRVDALLDGLATGDFADGSADVPSPEVVRACHELSVALLGLAADVPLVLGVDDLRHADVPSLRFLLHLVRRLGQASILLVLTDHTTPWPLNRRFRGELSRPPYAQRLRLDPLSRSGALRLVADELGEVAARRVGEEFLAAAGGNPLLLHALIEDHRQPGGAPSAQGYGLALLSCLQRAEPVMLQAVRALAVLGPGGTPAEIGRLMSGDLGTSSSAEEALRALDAADLLEGSAFRHPAARAAVLDDLSPYDRSELHRRAACLLYERGAGALDVARHLIEAGHTRLPWAEAVLSEAAEHALLEDRLELAADCLKLAHAASADERSRSALRARLAQAEWQLNPSSAARHLAPLTAAVRADQLSLSDGLVLIRQLLWHGRSEEAVDVLGRLRALAGGAQASPAEAAALRDIEVWLAWTHPALARGRRTPVLPADLRHGVVTPGTDPQLQAAAALADALSRGRAEDAADRAERVLRDLPLHRRSPWAEEAALVAVRVLIQVDRLEAAAAWCDRLLADAEGRNAPTAQAVFAAARAEVAVQQGDLTAAGRHAHDALGLLTPRSWGVAVGLPLSVLILAATRMGEREEAARQLTHSIGDTMFHSRYGLQYLYARGHHYLATDHCHAALADFLSCGELLRDWGLDTAGLLPWRTNAAEAWLRLDNKDQASRLIHEQLARSGAGTSRTRGPALRLLAAVGPPGRRLPLLTEAIDLAEASGDRFEQVRVLTELSRAHRANNDKRRARLLLRQALHVANMCEMKPLAQELLSVSADLGGSESMADGLEGVASLTDSERRVASLAVLGYTNREIAVKLYVTASTVEQHLTRVYRKLKIRRRKDLPADLWANLRKAG
ncbi:AAA family ATPase [Streptomyces sp. cmx-18-6]|uniref:AAA family ATPase n=1 Tax=Streptomyces sp. cmx-18-6 TaxID=2790930 RepID=UPI00397F28A9